MPAVSEADKAQLAALVRSHPVLYDRRYAFFNDRAQQHYAWQDISRRMMRTGTRIFSLLIATHKRLFINSSKSILIIL